MGRSSLETVSSAEAKQPWLSQRQVTGWPRFRGLYIYLPAPSLLSLASLLLPRGSPSATFLPSFPPSSYLLSPLRPPKLKVTKPVRIIVAREKSTCTGVVVVEKYRKKPTTPLYQHC